LFSVSPATADRILRVHRQAERPHGLATTEVGSILKHQVPVRTFTEWNDARPGFVEADLVAHCGASPEGSFLHTLVLTDVATGWTECLALPYRSQHVVVQALERAQQLLPFPLLGLDTDNGGEFLNAEVFTFCQREQITFTRGRAYRKNDQCYIEQKNGAIVRQMVGYDRFEGERAYRQLTELYRAVRLYVNIFQPSMKLLTKRRDGNKVSRTYDSAQTPLQRLLVSGILTPGCRDQLERLAHALDPVRQHAVLPASPRPLSSLDGEPPEVRFSAQTCLASAGEELDDPTPPPLVLAPKQEVSAHPGQTKWAYRRTKPQQEPRWWRTRLDPFGEVWGEICGWLMERPERTAKSVLQELQQRYPGQYGDDQLQTLQRRVRTWRARAILVFDDGWLEEDIMAGHAFPRPVRAGGDGDQWRTTSDIAVV
jgi:hypothetical protein